MTTPPPQFARLGEFPVTVYHGTRRSLADAILRDGFQPTPVGDQTAAIAQEYGVSLGDVQQHLATKPNFSAADPDRAHTVSTTGDPYKAGSWAERAPEATWDALRAVYLLTHPDDEDRYGNSEAAAFWVMAQRVDDPPAVVSARTPLSALQGYGHSAGETALDELWWSVSQTPGIGDPEQFTNAVMGFFDSGLFKESEWRIPIEAAEVVGVSPPVPFRVYPSLLAYLSQRSVIDLGPPRQCSAEWGPPGNEGHPGSAWWPFDRVWNLLSPQRRAALEDFAGRSIKVGQGT